MDFLSALILADASGIINVPMAEQKYIAVIDFGSQYTHLIIRNLRELGIVSRLLPPTVSLTQLKGAAGLILSGGPKSVIKQAVPYNPKLLRLRLPLPILGVCYGLQLIARDLGGRVAPGKIREYGSAKLHRHGDHPLFRGVPPLSTVWMSHGDSVTKLPPGFKIIGSTTTLPCAAVAHRRKPIFGLQFHPEVHHTNYGRTILRNFACHICRLKPTTVQGQLEKITAEIKAQAGNKKVFLLVSGGVDSTVAFALLNQTLGLDQVYGLHIDTGLLRYQESKLVKRRLAAAGFKNLRVVNARALFARRLRHLTEPEAKRQAIGLAFLDTKLKVERQLKLNTKHWLLGQGTIYPDTIESGGTKHADKIKTHHNRIDVLQKLARQGLLVEPLKELYKDEVRELGLKLRLPRELIWTHPFPGPALGVRVLCLNKKTANQLNCETLPKIEVSGYHSRILPVLSVGVQGDERSYRRPLAIEANYGQATKLHRRATLLLNQHRSINRVLLKLAGPKLESGQGHAAELTPPRVRLAQQADRIVMAEIKRGRIYHKLWQCPTVIVPFGLNPKSESIVLRPFASREAMTGRAYLLSSPVVSRIVRRLKALPRVDFIFYDLTDKPPGTVEWE